MGSGDRSPSDGRTDRPPGPSATHTADPPPRRLLGHLPQLLLRTSRPDPARSGSCEPSHRLVILRGAGPLDRGTPSQTKSTSTRPCVRANGGSDWVGARRNSTGIRLNSWATSTKTFKYVARTTPTA